MERCTERSLGGYGILKNGYTNEFALCKLATYEDTGLEPEEIKKLGGELVSLEEINSNNVKLAINQIAEINKKYMNIVKQRNKDY